MRKIKYIFISLCLFLFSCNQYDQGYSLGYEEALQLGKEEGYEEGYEEGKSQGIEETLEFCSIQSDALIESASILCNDRVDALIQSYNSSFNQGKQLDYTNFMIQFEKEYRSKVELEFARKMLKELDAKD